MKSRSERHARVAPAKFPPWRQPALIFGIHPVHVASVAWISELKNLLAMFLALLSVLYFLDSRGRDGPPGRPSDSARPAVAPYRYTASLVFFALALLSKTQVVFLPVVLLLCAWWWGVGVPPSGGQSAVHLPQPRNRGTPSV